LKTARRHAPGSSNQGNGPIWGGIGPVCRLVMHMHQPPAATNNNE
jgi:hypothetical protein